MGILNSHGFICLLCLKYPKLGEKSFSIIILFMSLCPNSRITITQEWKVLESSFWCQIVYILNAGNRLYFALSSLTTSGSKIQTLLFL